MLDRANLMAVRSNESEKNLNFVHLQRVTMISASGTDFALLRVVMNEQTTDLIKQMNTHLSQFKEMSHRAKIRIEKLAELSLVIEDDLKQKEYADRVSELFGIAANFEEKMDGLIYDYEIERNRIQNEAA